MKISKELLKGTTALLVLRVISEEDLYGYRIMEEIAARSSDTFCLGEGTLYPILHTLEREGWVESYRGQSETGRERRYYRITAAGRLHLDARVEEWNAFTRAVNDILREEASHDRF